MVNFSRPGCFRALVFASVFPVITAAPVCAQAQSAGASPASRAHDRVITGADHQNPSWESQSDSHAVRGIVTPQAKADISVSLSARLANVPYELGDAFSKGAVLIAFDCNRLEADHAAARAAYQSLTLKAENARELFAHGASGELDMKTAIADARQAQAQAAAIQAQIDECTIKAPYDGFVAERHIDPFETPSAGTPLLKIIKDAKPEIRMIAPSGWLRWMKPGADFSFTVDETAETSTGTIKSVGVLIDSASQTVTLIGVLDGEAPSIRAGMSGTATFIKSGGA